MRTSLPRTRLMERIPYPVTHPPDRGLDSKLEINRGDAPASPETTTLPHPVFNLAQIHRFLHDLTNESWYGIIHGTSVQVCPLITCSFLCPWQLLFPTSTARGCSRFGIGRGGRVHSFGFTVLEPRWRIIWNSRFKIYVCEEQIFSTPDFPDIDHTNSHSEPLSESQRTPSSWPQR